MIGRPNLAVEIAFLDVLTNAMAAILIITLSNIQPGPPGVKNPGFHFVRMTPVDGATEVPFRLAIDLGDGTFLHDTWEAGGSGVRIRTTPEAVTVFFLERVDLERLDAFGYVVDPDWNLPPREFLIEANFGEFRASRIIRLGPGNGYVKDDLFDELRKGKA